MATRTILESDLSGRPDAITESIGLSGEWCTIDLTTAERAELKDFLAPYRKAGRRVGPTLKKRVVPETTVEERETIRAWAQENGYEFAPYGRIPKRILAAYAQAHPEAGDRLVR
ncbi:MAG: Lsr2 dimerization domain-containing protein [Leucobacter sp.]